MWASVDLLHSLPLTPRQYGLCPVWFGFFSLRLTFSVCDPSLSHSLSHLLPDPELPHSSTEPHKTRLYSDDDSPSPLSVILGCLFFHLFHFPSSFSLLSLLCGKRVIVFFLFHHRMNVRCLEMLSFAVTFLQLTLSNVLQVDDFPHIWRRIQSRSRPGFVSISRNQRDQQADICNRSSYAVKKKKKKILMWTFWSTTVWILPLRYIYLITSVTL